MNIVSVPAEQTYLFELLKMVSDEGIILQTTDGQQFIVLSLASWHGFDVGDSDDFEQEVQQTAQNTQLLTFLAERKNAGQRVPIAHVQKLLGHS